MKLSGVALAVIALTICQFPARSLAQAPDASLPHPAAGSDRTDGAAARSSSGSPPPLATTEVDYIVAKGDTLIGIGRRLLKPDIEWHYLRALNRLDDARELRAGQRLRIPVTWLREDVIAFTVKSVTGTATINGNAVQPDVKVDETDTIETGDDGTVVVVLPDGTEVRIAPSSQVRIDRLRKYFGGESIDARLRLERGGIDAVVPSRYGTRPSPGTIVPRIPQTAPASGAITPTHRIRIETPRATAAVRGTSFRVNDGEAVTSSAVLQGLVAFESNTPQAPGNVGGQPATNEPTGTVKSVELPAGFGSAADDSGNVAKPEVMLPAPRIEPVVDVVPQPSRKVDFAAIEGAAGYRVRTAADPAFTQDVRERVVKTPIAIVDSTRDGTWYVAARGISPTGVEGYDTTINLVFDARPAPPIVSQPNDKATLFGTTTKLEWLEPEGIGRFRLQIARDAAFRDLIVDEDVSEPRYTYAARDDEPAPRKRYWRIAAIDDTGRGPFQVAREFTQRDAGGPAASAEVSETGGTRLSWPPIPDASYIVALKPLTQGATPAAEFPSQEPALTLPQLAPGRYEIAIISVFEGDLRSPPSAPQKFTIPLLWKSGFGSPIIIDNQTVPAVTQPE